MRSVAGCRFPYGPIVPLRHHSQETGRRAGPFRDRACDRGIRASGFEILQKRESDGVRRQRPVRSVAGCRFPYGPIVPLRHHSQETGRRAGPFRDRACDRGIRASGFEILQKRESDGVRRQRPVRSVAGCRFPYGPIVPLRHHSQETGRRAGPFRDRACDRGIRASGFEILQKRESDGVRRQRPVRSVAGCRFPYGPIIPLRHHSQETGRRAGPFRDRACDRGIRASGFEILQKRESDGVRRQRPVRSVAGCRFPYGPIIPLRHHSQETGRRAGPFRDRACDRGIRASGFEILQKRESDGVRRQRPVRSVAGCRFPYGPIIPLRHHSQETGRRAGPFRDRACDRGIRASGFEILQKRQSPRATQANEGEQREELGHQEPRRHPQHRVEGARRVSDRTQKKR